MLCDAVVRCPFTEPCCHRWRSHLLNAEHSSAGRQCALGEGLVFWQIHVVLSTSISFSPKADSFFLSVGHSPVTLSKSSNSWSWVTKWEINSMSGEARLRSRRKRGEKNMEKHGLTLAQEADWNTEVLFSIMVALAELVVQHWGLGETFGPFRWRRVLLFF